MPDLNEINGIIQSELTCRDLPCTTAVEAANWLAGAGALRDSATRPGKPLRDLLRAGRIAGQRQDSNGRWYIERVKRATADDRMTRSHNHAAARSEQDEPNGSKSAPNPLQSVANRPIGDDLRRRADALFNAVGLSIDGSTRWGGSLSAGRPGVYVVQWDLPLSTAPIDMATLNAWIKRVPTLRLDGQVPTAEALVDRLAEYWIPDETILYVGLSSRAIGTRVSAYYRTPLGDARPHAGGHWLKALSDYETHAIVRWAHTADFSALERRLLNVFADQASASAGHIAFDPIMPFANLVLPGGTRKSHGISGSRLP